MFEYLVVIGVLSAHGATGTVDCRLIKDDVERLACYDATAPQPPAATIVPDAVKAPPKGAPAAENFGLTEEQRQQKIKDPTPTIEMIESRVAAVERHRWDDRFMLTLENGQKWAQLEPTPTQRFYVGDAITIRKAALNSYLARGPSSGAAIRVRRVD